MALKPINGQYTNTNNIIKTYSAGGKYFVAFKGGIEIELTGNTAQNEYETLSAYFDKIRANEFANKDTIYKTYTVGGKYYLEFVNGTKIEINQQQYEDMIKDGGESPIDPESLNDSISVSNKIKKTKTSTKLDIGIDTTGATADQVLKMNSAGTGLEWGSAGANYTAGSGIDITDNAISISGLASATEGQVLTAGATAGTASWSTPSWLEEVKASDVDSESATSGQVLTADGSGGASWQSASGGTTLNKYSYRTNGTTSGWISRLKNIITNSKGNIYLNLNYYSYTSASISITSSDDIVINYIGNSAGNYIICGGCYIDTSNNVYSSRAVKLKSDNTIEYLSQNPLVSGWTITYWNDTEIT